jgi:hypothetical protein
VRSSRGIYTPLTTRKGGKHVRSTLELCFAMGECDIEFRLTSPVLSSWRYCIPHVYTSPTPRLRIFTSRRTYKVSPFFFILPSTSRFHFLHPRSVIALTPYGRHQIKASSSAAFRARQSKGDKRKRSIHLNPHPCPKQKANSRVSHKLHRLHFYV